MPADARWVEAGFKAARDAKFLVEWSTFVQHGFALRFGSILLTDLISPA
jgi:hypothetical protein